MLRKQNAKDNKSVRVADCKHILLIIYGETLLDWLFHLHVFSGLTVFGSVSSHLIYFSH